MSKTIVELEANTNPSESIRNTLTSYLNRYGDWTISISVRHSEGIYFEVVIKAKKEEEETRVQLLPLAKVPTIKEYLLEEGMLQSAYDTLVKKLDHQKKEAHIYLFGE